MLTELALAKQTCLRDLCGLMVYPSLILARSDPQFRLYVIGFSHEVALAEASALSIVNRTGGGGVSGNKLGQLLRQLLIHLDEPTYRARM